MGLWPAAAGHAGGGDAVAEACAFRGSAKDAAHPVVAVRGSDRCIRLTGELGGQLDAVASTGFTLSVLWTAALSILGGSMGLGHV